MQTGTPRFSGQRLVEARNAAGMKQHEVAARAGVHQAQLSRWENGQVPGADVVGRLAHAIGCSVGDFYVAGDGASGDDEDEESDLLEAAHALDRAGAYALADRMRARAREVARTRERV